MLGTSRKSCWTSVGPSMDAAGLGEIIWAFNSVCRHGANLHLLNSTRRVRRVLEISRVDTLIPVQ